LSREKTVLLTRATEERAKTNVFRTRSSHVCLSAVVPAFAEPDIHLLSRARGPSQKIEFVFSASPETIRREPREFDLLRSVGHLRDLASCAPWNPVIFFLTPVGRFKPPPCFALLPARSLVSGDPRLADTQPSSGLRPASLGFRSPSASPFHGSGLAHGSVWAPVSRLRPAHVVYVCCAVWKAVSAGPCLRNSSLLSKAHNS
jgi:hypothetical protein